MARGKPGLATLAQMKREAMKYIKRSHDPYEVSLHHSVAYARGVLLMFFVDKSKYIASRSEYRVAFWDGNTNGMVFDMIVHNTTE